MRGPFAREHFGAAKQLVVPPGASIDSMRQAHVQAALAHVSAGGADDLFLEFGVREGRMINFSSSLTPDRVWHGFDSFQGLPQDRRDGGRKAKPRTWRKGDYTVEMPIVRSNVRLHVGWFNSSLRSFLATLDASSPPPRVAFCQMDAVLLIRAVHNLARFESQGGFLTAAIQNTFDILKPGGVVGIVQHQARDEMPDEWADGSKGYLKKSFVIDLMERTGFELVGESDINQNPKDQPTAEDIVWRLPPSLATSKDNDELKNSLESIGESNRMTLKFKKPV